MAVDAGAKTTSREDLLQRLHFLGLTEEDRRCLKRLQPILEAQADKFVAEFYRRLAAFEPTRKLLEDPEVQERVFRRQREYLLSLAGPQIDEAYVAERVRIGETHQRVGLEPRWYLGAYVLYLRLLIPRINQAFRGDPALAERTTFALIKTLMLDADLAMEAYLRHRELQVGQLRRELAEATRALTRRNGGAGDDEEHSPRADERAWMTSIVTGLAHEIGTPLGVIQGHSEALQSSVSDAAGRRRLDTIREQIDRISSMIRILLDTRQTPPPRAARVEIRDVVQRSIGFVTEKLRRRGIEAKLELPLRALLRGDSERLQQVFLNLFLNATDAMPHGGTLRVSMERAGDDEVRVRVSDTGEGMTREVLERIFEPFFTTKPAGAGNGLGLVVAKGIVHDHGGMIEGTSVAGGGAEFSITFPCQEIGPAAGE